MTSYIGEFINTLTSLFYSSYHYIHPSSRILKSDKKTAYLGLRGIATVWSRRELGVTSVLPYVAVIVLGIASALYHSTLKYPMQLRMLPSLSSFPPIKSYYYFCLCLPLFYLLPTNAPIPSHSRRQLNALRRRHHAPPPLYTRFPAPPLPPHLPSHQRHRLHRHLRAHRPRREHASSNCLCEHDDHFCRSDQ